MVPGVRGPQGPHKARCPRLRVGMKDTLLPSPVGPAGLRPAGRAVQEASALGWALGSWRLLARPHPMLGSPRPSGPVPHRPLQAPRSPQPLGRVAAAHPLLLAQPSTPGAERSQQCLWLKASREATRIDVNEGPSSSRIAGPMARPRSPGHASPLCHAEAVINKNGRWWAICAARAPRRGHAGPH